MTRDSLPVLPVATRAKWLRGRLVVGLVAVPVAGTWSSSTENFPLPKAGKPSNRFHAWLATSGHSHV
jgi:hypothetical protein